MIQQDDELTLDKPRQKTLQWLGISALITVLLWQMPFGGLVLYPFTILATWFHEMGHGLTALLLGGRFHQLLIFADGSGVAYHSSAGGLAGALVAAGGLMGPPIAGAFFILSGRSPGRSRLVLTVLGAMLLLSTVVWVRSGFGWLILPMLAVALLAVARRGPDWLQPMTIQFLGVQACINTYHQLDYLFMAQANVGGQVMRSDTGQIAAALLLPYWFWGGLIAGFSFVLLAASLWVVGRASKASA
ncbi:MAG TPA: M50 family metallopeptidase [Candidatus Obscuribacterales bacterium]